MPGDTPPATDEPTAEPDDECPDCRRLGRHDRLRPDGGRRLAKRLRDCDRHFSWREVYRRCAVDPDDHTGGQQ